MLKEKTAFLKKIPDKLNLFFTFKNFNRISTYFFAAVVIFQFLGICYFNVFQMEHHLGYDASACMLKARMMWEQKTLFPEMYAGQTTLMFEGSEVLAALIYGITKNLCLAFAIANIMLTVLTAAVLILVFKQLNMSNLAALIGLSVFLMPFIALPYYNSNPLSYFFCMFFGCSFLSVRMLTVLITYVVYINLVKGKRFDLKLKFLTVGLFALYLLCSISSGISLILYVVAPILLFEFINVISKSDFSVIFNLRLLFIIAASAVIFLGKNITVTVFGFPSAEEGIKLIGLGKFWDNFFNIFIGFLKLTSAGGVESIATVFSPEGKVYLGNILFTAIFIFALVWTIYKIVKFSHKETDAEESDNDSGEAATNKQALCYLICSCLVNMFIYILLDTTYGAPLFEERYLIITYITGAILIGYFVDNFSKASFYRVCVVVLAFVMVFSSFSSYKALDEGKTSISSELTEACQKYDTKVVYGYGVNNLGIYLRNMRVLDDKKVYKLINSDGTIHHWGDYTYYDEVTDYTGGVLFIVPNGFYEEVPAQYKPFFEYKETVLGYDFYTSNSNPFDFSSALPSKGKNVDYPYSPGVVMVNTLLNQNCVYQTDGIEGFNMYGPYAPINEGTFEFTLFYDVKSSDSDIAGTFDIAVNYGNRLVVTDVSASENSVTLEVKLSGLGVFEYRLFNYENSVIEIHRIEIEKIS